MHNITISNLNKNSKEITNYLIKYVNGNPKNKKIGDKDWSQYVSIMTGKNSYLNRADYSFAHLRFGDTYLYYTTSIFQDVKSELKQKIEEDLLDWCFNIRAEVLNGSSCSKDWYFLVDTGRYLVAVDKDYARKHIIAKKMYKGKLVYSVRLPKANFVNKRFLQNDVVVKFDAKYLQHVRYGKNEGSGRYRGLIEVTISDEKGVELQKNRFSSITEAYKKYGESVGRCFGTWCKVANKSGTMKLKKDGRNLFVKLQYVDSQSAVRLAEVKIENNIAQVIINNKNISSSQLLRSKNVDKSQHNHFNTSIFLKHDHDYIDNEMVLLTEVNRVGSKKVNKLEKIIKSAYKPLITKDKDLKPDWYEEELN